MVKWLGEFEQSVLFAVARLGDPYGAAVREDIITRTGRQVSSGAVYTTLARLEAHGLIGSRWGEPTPERGGKRKRHYRLRQAGREALARSWRAAHAMSEGLAPKLVKP